MNHTSSQRRPCIVVALALAFLVFLAAPMAFAADSQLAPIRITPERRQLIGLKFATVVRKDVSDRLETTGTIDVSELLSQVKIPTLVMHPRGDAQVPMELGRQMAAGISGAKFVALQSNNHVLLEQDPAAPRFFEEINLFLAK